MTRQSRDAVAKVGGGGGGRTVSAAVKTAVAVLLALSMAGARTQLHAAKGLIRAKVAAGEATKPAGANATDVAAAAKEHAGGGGGGLLARYEFYLQSCPISTKMVTGAFLWGVGDIAAQAFVVDEARDWALDRARLGRAVFYGFAIHAPVSHWHYNFLEWMTVRARITGGVKVSLFKCFMEQFVYWSWICTALYHGAMGAMQGWSMRQCYDHIASAMWDTQKAQWAFWIPVQLVNFRFVPVRHQLNAVLLMCVPWTALLSAWYPPEKRKETIERKQSAEGTTGSVALARLDTF